VTFLGGKIQVSFALDPARTPRPYWRRC